MRTRKPHKFRVTFEVEIEIAPVLLKSVLTDEWRKVMVDYHRAEDHAAHIAFNMVRGCSLKEIDGYADQDDESVRCGDLCMVDVVEIK